MYEDQTFENILRRMLERVPESIDKREGSIIYDALSPAAYELALAYQNLDNAMDQTFADTAEREWLIKRAADRGISPYPATPATRKAICNETAPDLTGKRFSAENSNINFVVIARMTAGSYQVQCETAGIIGNGLSGNLIPIEFVAGLEWITLSDILIPGEDDEDTEALRKRYLNSFETQAYGGNIADYREKTNALPGVGGVKVYPIWNGGGTVKLVILTSDFGTPTQELVDSVQEAIQPLKNGVPDVSTTGTGIAPIGHFVTVEAAIETVINVEMRLTYQQGWDWTGVKENVENAIDDYFLSLCKGWEDEATVVVRIAHIETRMLEIQGIIDVADTKLNGLPDNIEIASNHIPKRGDVNAV